MASSENTAVNDLVARVSGGQASTPSARMTALVPPAAPPSLPVPDPMHTPRPVTMPVAAPFEAPSLPMTYPVVHRAESEPHVPAHLIDPDRREQFVGTVRMRHSDLRIVVGKVVLPMMLLVIAGLLIGGYVVFRVKDGQPRSTPVPPGAAAQPARLAPVAPVTAPAPVLHALSAAKPALAVAEPAVPEPMHAEPEPAAVANAGPAAVANAGPATAAVVNVEPAPAATPATPGNAATLDGAEPFGAGEPAAPTPMLVDVRIDSTPSGATVTLVDRGKNQFVGKTPVSVTLDASREYDLLFTFPSQATQLEHLNAKTTRHVAVTLGANGSPAKATDSAPRHVDKPVVTRAPATPARKPAAATAPVAPVKKPAKVAAEPALAEGTLMVSSKPPCEIVIDGKPTGLTTPQRSITLATGNHKITLVNSEKNIKKTVSVRITANTTEKVIEDLMP